MKTENSHYMNKSKEIYRQNQEQYAREYPQELMHHIHQMHSEEQQEVLHNKRERYNEIVAEIDEYKKRRDNSAVIISSSSDPKEITAACDKYAACTAKIVQLGREISSIYKSEMK